MFVVVETDPATKESHVLYPQGSMAQIHSTLGDAERHRNWYINQVYVESPDSSEERVRTFRLKPLDAGLPILRALRAISTG